MRKQKKLIFRFGIEPLTKLDESVLVIKVLFKGLLYEPQLEPESEFQMWKNMKY